VADAPAAVDAATLNKIGDFDAMGGKARQKMKGKLFFADPLA